MSLKLLTWTTRLSRYFCPKTTPRASTFVIATFGGGLFPPTSSVVRWVSFESLKVPAACVPAGAQAGDTEPHFVFVRDETIENCIALVETHERNLFIIARFVERCFRA